MKLYTLSVLLLTASASCTPMKDPVKNRVALLKAYDQGERKRTVEFGLRVINFNGVSTRYTDASFLSVVNKIFSLTQSRYEYLLKIWKEATYDHACTCSLQEYLRGEMLFLKDGFLKELMQAYPVQEYLQRDPERTRKLFVDILDLFEKIHTLRVQVCRTLPAQDKTKVSLQLLHNDAEEKSFQRYADLLQIPIKVHDRFERMRKCTI